MTLTNRHETPTTSSHWLLMGQNRYITGCNCGFHADEADAGYGDSVIRHIEAAVREQIAADIEAQARPDGVGEPHWLAGIRHSARIARGGAA